MLNLLFFLQSFGDMADLPKFLKRARFISEKLEAAGDKIEQINSEEDAFDFERSQYPQRSKARNTLDPYLKLYATVTDFQEKQK